MAMITFCQVVARYLFNSGAVWALELTTYLFAWLVLIGASYGFKISAHLGVDAFVKLFPARHQRYLILLAGLVWCVYAVIMRSDAHTSELSSLIWISYAVFR